ncbi:thioredoxin domain-containing protein [Cryobacterium sp. PH31-O1]|uniref:thioredoxin domain-containing protein n=1 Tax=Cryobacterium sp. PH31-O1 TaxID=3046306 RepID=UPI0024BA451B|nr:thioredoxin domain-containing protein [Cryobacterium sp. PH31-O1]MDJ0338054.1 thioredoxin domain-containing protein [Cryobacterium sp. PH31-O1]
MPNHLADAISPYLRSHADNPVAWFGWGEEAFREARRRDVPVLVSIGYSTCHWCHVMARESFSDPAIAEYLNAHLVSIKVDREEHPDVDASYLAAASAFTDGLGWPLNVFVTPDGQAFHAGTYFPPVARAGHPSFREVLTAVTTAWLTRRAEVTAGAARVADLLADSARELAAGAARFGANAQPGIDVLDQTVAELVGYEDARFGGFGGSPKFPVAPALSFLLGHGDHGHEELQGEGPGLALRTLKIMGASPLRDPIEGGFFRYAVNRNWSDPHYERMLYDNAQLLSLCTRAWMITGQSWARNIAEGIARFLCTVMQLPSGGFASAQDSESTVDGQRVEGGYYTLERSERARQTPPALDEKVLTGWNGLAIQALARAGFAFDRPDLIAAARRAADYLREQHERADGTLVRASVSGRGTEPRISAAAATLEDYGMYSRGLLELALVTGEVTYATRARHLLESTLSGTTDTGTDMPAFRPPNGADPVLSGQGLVSAIDPSEGAYPSGLSAAADAALLLHRLTGDDRYRRAAQVGLSLVASLAPARPLAYGAALAVFDELSAPIEQLVIVSPDHQQLDTRAPVTLTDLARRHPAPVVACVSESQARAFAAAGFDLFAARAAPTGQPTGYLCRDFVCQLPVTDPAQLPPVHGTAMLLAEIAAEIAAEAQQSD